MLAYFYCTANNRMKVNESSINCDRIYSVQCTVLMVGEGYLSTSPPMSLRKALLPSTNCRYQFTYPEGMDSLVSRSTCVRT